MITGRYSWDHKSCAVCICSDSLAQHALTEKMDCRAQHGTLLLTTVTTVSQHGLACRLTKFRSQNFRLCPNVRSLLLRQACPLSRALAFLVQQLWLIGLCVAAQSGHHSCCRKCCQAECDLQASQLLITLVYIHNYLL